MYIYRNDHQSTYRKIAIYLHFNFKISKLRNLTTITNLHFKAYEAATALFPLIKEGSLIGP